MLYILLYLVSFVTAFIGYALMKNSQSTAMKILGLLVFITAALTLSYALYYMKVSIFVSVLKGV